VVEFLDRLKLLGKHRALVTNAHHKSLMLKLERTALHHHLDDIICSHDFGMPKENTDFWGKLHARLPFDKQHTLLVDDSLPVLRSAHAYGISGLLAVSKPDSQSPQRQVDEFQAIYDFSDIMPEL